MRYKFINKIGDRPTFLCNNFQCRTSLIHSCAILQFLKAENLQRVFFFFFSDLSYFQLDIVKILKQHCFQFCFTTWWRNITVEYKCMITYCMSVVVIGIRYNRTALRYKWLYSVMSWVEASHPGEQVSRPGPSICCFFVFFNRSILWVRYRNIGSTPSIYCIVTDKVHVCMAE